MTQALTNDGRFGERMAAPMDRAKAIIRSGRDDRASPPSRAAVGVGAKSAPMLVKPEARSLGSVCEPMN